MRLLPAALSAVLPPCLLVVSACGWMGPSLPPEEIVKVPGEGTVVVYVETPRRNAGPVLKTFEEQTGIKVSPVYRETLGDRFFPTLKSEAERGAADVFWGESPLSACALTEADLATPFRPAGARPVPAQYPDRGVPLIGLAANPPRVVHHHPKKK